MAFNPNEPRDYHGRWTDYGGGTVPKYIIDKANENLISELTPEEQKLLNQDYESEQQFREQYQKLIESRQASDNPGSQTGTGSSGSNGGDNQISESEKEALQKTVSNYIDKHGKEFDLPGRVDTSVVLDENRSREIALAYNNLPENDSKNPKVVEAYNQLAKEVDVQYKYLTNDLGIKTQFSENDPYSNSKEMVNDVVKNKRLKVYSGGEDHPLLGKITKDSNGLTANEKFRAVHDYFGHAIEQNQFGKLGEEKAWVEHSKMFSPLAQTALTTETRGQNSWVNFSGANTQSLQKMNEGNRLIKLGQSLKGRELVEQGKKEFQFAVQKVALLPDKYTNWKVYKK